MTARPAPVAPPALPPPALPPAVPPRGLVSANLVCMASMIVWAAGLPAAELVIRLLPAVQLGALRMILAAAALLPLWLLVDGAGAIRRADWPRGIAVGSLIGIAAWTLVMGQARSGPVTAAVISAMSPVIGIALEVVLDGRRITRALVAGLALALAGGLIALNFRSGGVDFGIGAALCLVSIISFTLGSRLTVTAFPAVSPLGRTALTITGAAIVMTLVAGVPVITRHALRPDFSGWGWREAGGMLLFSVGALAVSQLLWILSVGRLGIGNASLHVNAAPFYVMLILFAFGAPWNWTQAAGAALVGLGVLVAQGIVQGIVPSGSKR